MEELSEEQIEEFREAFSLFDPEGNGYIFTKDLGTVLRSLGIHTSDEEKNSFINKYDKTSSGFIYFKNFLEIIISKVSETKPEDEMTEAFKLFDRENNNYVVTQNFIEELKLNCPGITDAEVAEMTGVLSEDKNIIKIEDVVTKLMNAINPLLN